MIKKWSSFIKESINSNIINFYNEYKGLFSDPDDDDLDNIPSKIDLYDEIGELTLKHNLSYEDVGYILNSLDTSFDTDGLLKSTYNTWVDENVSKTTNIDLKSRIEDLIHSNIRLRQVPYSQTDDMEADPDSVESAATEIIDMLKKEGLI